MAGAEGDGVNDSDGKGEPHFNPWSRIHSMLTIPFLILGALLFVLALPPALKRRSWKTFFASLVLSFFGVLLPLFVFLFSSGMEPEWKGACAFGWLDCFIVGKLALAPLALVATAALYALEIFRVENRTRQWMVVGVFLGAIVASICFAFGLACIGSEADAHMLKLWLLVPFYTAVWYSIRAVQLIKAARWDFWTYYISLIGSLPFWLASWYWSHSLYEALPNKAPADCFVVTAAARGHESIVGPFFEINHSGRIRRANRQLITLWQFEALWRARAPLSHALFRHAYNRLGPAIAGRITSPGVADLAHFAIKPMELLAALAVKGAAGGKRKASS